jgi:hypothetical protein
MTNVLAPSFVEPWNGYCAIGWDVDHKVSCDFDVRADTRHVIGTLANDGPGFIFESVVGKRSFAPGATDSFDG